MTILHSLSLAAGSSLALTAQQQRLSGDVSVSRTQAPSHTKLHSLPCPGPSPSHLCLCRSDSDPVECGPCHLAQQSKCPSWVCNILARGSTTPSMPMRPLKKSFLSPWPAMITQHFFKMSVNVGWGSLGCGGCNPPPEEHRSSRWLLLRATVVIAFPVVSSDLAQAASSSGTFLPGLRPRPHRASSAPTHLVS